MEKGNTDLAAHYLEYLQIPENRDVIGDIGEELGRGVQGIIYSIGRSDSVLKLYFDTPKNLQVTRSEACRQEDFGDAIWYGYKMGIPRDVLIPELLHKIYNKNGQVIGIVMRKIDGKSLNTIEAGKIAIDTGEITQEEFEQMSEGEFIKKFGHLREGYKYYPDDFNDGSIDSDLLSRIKQVQDFFQKFGLEHGDLHSGNIMLGKNGELYFLDFGKSIINPKKADMYRQALTEGKAYRLDTLLHKNVVPDFISDSINIVGEVEFSSIEAVPIRDENFTLYHNGIPRSISFQCMAIAYAKLKSKDPRIDNYYHQSRVGYEIGGGYFLVCEEFRNEGVENEFSKEVLNQVTQPNQLRGYIEDSTGKRYYVYSINQDTSNIITQVTENSVDKIIK